MTSETPRADEISETSSPVRRSRRGRNLAILGFAVVLVIAGAVAYVVAAQPFAQTRVTVTGSLQLNVVGNTGMTLDLGTGACHGTGGYSDIRAGASIVVRDEHQTTVATGTLGSGSGVAHQCDFNFTITDVPDGAIFYSVEIANRGAITKSRDEMAKNGWRFSLSIGE